MPEQKKSENPFETETQILSLQGADRECLRLDFPFPMNHDGVTYPSPLHHIIAMKTTNREDLKMIRVATFPDEIKAIERSIKPPSFWNKETIWKLVEANMRIRIAKDPQTRKLLIKTRPKTIEDRGGEKYTIDEIADEHVVRYGKILEKIRGELL